MDSFHTGLVTDCVAEIECRATNYLVRFPLVFACGSVSDSSGYSKILICHGAPERYSE